MARRAGDRLETELEDVHRLDVARWAFDTALKVNSLYYRAESVTYKDAKGKKGGHADLHLPLGAGNLNLHESLQALKECGFDDTITLEVFTPDRHFLAYSRDVLRRASGRVRTPKDV